MSAGSQRSFGKSTKPYPTRERKNVPKRNSGHLFRSLDGCFSPLFWEVEWYLEIREVWGMEGRVPWEVQAWMDSQFFSLLFKEESKRAGDHSFWSMFSLYQFWAANSGGQTQKSWLICLDWKGFGCFQQSSACVCKEAQNVHYLWYTIPLWLCFGVVQSSEWCSGYGWFSVCCLCAAVATRQVGSSFSIVYRNSLLFGQGFPIVGYVVDVCSFVWLV